MLQRLRSLVNRTDEEGSKLIPDLLGVFELGHLDVVAGLRVLGATGLVHHHNDVLLGSNQDLEDSLNVANGKGLPLLGRKAFWKPLQATDDEPGLVPDVLLIVAELGVQGSLLLDGLVQSTMVLL